MNQRALEPVSTLNVAMNMSLPLCRAYDYLSAGSRKRSEWIQCGSLAVPPNGESLKVATCPNSDYDEFLLLDL